MASHGRERLCAQRLVLSLTVCVCWLVALKGETRIVRQNVENDVGHWPYVFVFMYVRSPIGEIY